MKKTVLASLLSLSAAATMSMSQPAAAENAREQVIIRCGEQAAVKGSPKYFTGSVRIDPLYPANNEMRSSGGSVTFEPGARSHWHVHPVGQALIVISGVGRTQEWGKPIQEVRAGDVIICPVGVKHWHGAAPGSAMTHISICEEKEPGKVVEWLEPVTDEQYAGNVESK
ncbi:cupin domain-containing protein [uncultured Desulfovibrio sp.]|uniref:(R)-mandelonitrile lyase n=1 Tax=uncultured Desulfovibrio sp. TaxID=167968 RepID=UPI0026162039|nr:cupin domain-containing protein [uncultured Desulfovibrio sp.]